MGSGCIDPRVLDLCTSWWVVSFAPWPLYPQGTHYIWAAGWAQSRSGKRGEEKNLAPTGTRTLTPSVVQPVASRYTKSGSVHYIYILYIYSLNIIERSATAIILLKFNPYFLKLIEQKGGETVTILTLCVHLLTCLKYLSRNGEAASICNWPHRA
jgi:hypothetical protein